MAHPLRISLLTLFTLAAHLVAEVPKALPVDPSDITPDSGIKPVEPVQQAPESKPLPAGEVKLPEPENNPRSDTPDIDHLPTGEDAVRLQIFLDQQLFGPGVIDGKPGRFTVLAVNAWNEANGHPQNDLTAALAAARKAVPSPFATAIVPEVATQWVNTKLPYKRSQQAGAKRMSYRSYGEFMSERYHTDVEFLVEINGSSTVYGLAPRKALIVPNVKPFQVENLTGARYETEPLLANRHVVVDTKVNQARIYENTPTALVVGDDPDGPVQVRANRSLIAAFPITPGQERFIKYGLWEMRNAVQLPVWRYDQSLLDGKGRSKNAINIPPGPNSPVGVIWMGLSVSGIGIHGTSSPQTIGRSRSAGCIRMANWDAMRMPDLVRPGASVEIR
ncbi:L,D-transpeptidase [Haloferula sp. A504]|uniref:L,D-transpeptidase n=1 Tax=Haloferula sp. A504 TaxID=3373601 RepID=UPI0031BF0F1A|nr:L,D-transpeptidase [Verrucomicrobiaceae bacterium E54]